MVDVTLLKKSGVPFCALLQEGGRFVWLNLVIGLLTAILWAITAGYLFGESGTEFNRAFVVMRTLLGTASLGCALLLFFGLRALARMGLRKVGFTGHGTGATEEND